MGGLDLNYNDRAGVIDFTGAVYQGLTLRQMSYRVSDHLGVGAAAQVLTELGGQVNGGVVLAEARGGGRFALSLSKGRSFVKAPLSGIIGTSHLDQGEKANGAKPDFGFATSRGKYILPDGIQPF